MPTHVRDEIIFRTREWHNHYRELMNPRDSRHFDHEKFNQQQKKIREEREKKTTADKPDREERELEMFFGNRDRFDRFLIGYLVIVSSVIDRNYFTMMDEKSSKTIDEVKQMTL